MKYKRVAKSIKVGSNLEVIKTKLSKVNEAIDKYLLGIDTKLFKGKALEYTKLWMTLDVKRERVDRYNELASLIGMHWASIRNYSLKLKWSALDKLIVERDAYLEGLGLKPKELLTEVNVDKKVVEHREEEQIDLKVEEATKQAENPAFSQLAANLRETTVLSLSLLKDSLIYAYKMSTFYVRQIELVIESAGGMELLTPKHSETIMEYEKKVNKYLEGVKYAINPNSIFNNLKMLGYSSDLLKANEDTRVMTPDYIQKMLLEMVQGEGMRNYTQKPFEVMIEETDYADVELPSIDGRANKNKESDARNKQ